MSKSLNRCTFIGNLGKDPEIKYTPQGTAVANFSIAVNERYKDKSGEWQDKTEWVNVVAWQRLAEIVGEYVKKGSRIYIEGRFSTRSWEKDGVKQYRTEIVASDLILLGGRDEASSASREFDSQSKRGETPSSDRHDFAKDDRTEITDLDIPF